MVEGAKRPRDGAVFIVAFMDAFPVLARVECAVAEEECVAAVDLDNPEFRIRPSEPIGFIGKLCAPEQK
jgi:hypothetical protein